MATQYESVVSMVNDLSVAEMKQLQASLPDMITAKTNTTAYDAQQAHANPTYGRESYRSLNPEGPVDFDVVEDALIRLEYRKGLDD